MSLDAAHEIAVGIGGSHGRVGIDALRTVKVWIIVPLQSAHEIRREKGIDARLCRFGHEVAEAR